ncbi:hypothetical protein [Streptomyces purpureus]|uniref:hypothetical protein n=1 Tax=Streptomyces purpureus TaxID=1951 RepID=UPI001E47603A|nr:hypothetical protein [Streptomyces purpureus]
MAGTGMDRAGRIAAYGAAVALTPYVLIKVSWVIGSLLGLLPVGAGFGLAGWVVLNTVTIGMAATGIGLALALVRPWGLRIPAVPLAFCAWVGAGFLVAILPFALFSGVMEEPRSPPRATGRGPALPCPGGRRRWSSSASWAWAPAWRSRSPPTSYAAGLMRSPGGSGTPPPLPVPARLRRGRRSRARRSDLSGATGRRAERPGSYGRRRGTPRGALLGAVLGCWALAGALATAAITGGRPAGLRRGPVMAVGWLGSGALFAWSGWKVPVTLYVTMSAPADVAVPEHLALAGLLHGTAVASGAAMARMLVRATHANKVFIKDR